MILNDSVVSRFSVYLQALVYNGYRGLIHIVGREEFAIDQVNGLMKMADWQDVVCLPDNDQIQSISQTINKLLGTEIDALIINAYQGFNPNLLGAAAGCIRAGGVLVLITPENWPAFEDPDYQRMLSVTHNIHQIEGRFLSLVEETLNEMPLCVKVTEAPYDFHIPVIRQEKKFVPNLDEQAIVVSAIERVVNGHPKRPLVIQSDRGRGKSSALGIAAGKLLLNKPLHIIIASTHVNSVQAVFRHAAAELNIPFSGNELCYREGGLIFKPLDEVLHTSADLLLIDEAAAIPVDILQKLVKQYKRIVFSTTVQGYEGNGRGFALRFLPELLKQFPQSRMLEMQSPIRYAESDPLELFCKKALLLEHSVIEHTLYKDSLDIYEADRNQLLADKWLLKQVFSLLIVAHYQTTPDDLRILLDHPDISIFVVEQETRVLAVALVMNEGGFNAGQIAELQQNIRRYRGHLIPQTFFASGFAELLGMKTRRILRIAVHSGCRNQGLGKRLLDYIASHSSADFLGASFSVDVPVLRFWMSAACMPVRLGNHKESATAQYACIVLRALNSTAESTVKKLRHRYQQDILYQLAMQTSDCSASLAIVLLQECHYPVHSNDISQVNAYLLSRCSFEVAQVSLYRFVLHFVDILDFSSCIDAALIDKLFFNRSWHVLSKALGYSGRAQCERDIRERLNALVLMIN